MLTHNFNLSSKEIYCIKGIIPKYFVKTLFESEFLGTGKIFKHSISFEN